jgi:hypothetical protein
LSGKLKMPNDSLDLATVREELFFWFPGETLNIQYKDPGIFLVRFCILTYKKKDFLKKGGRG